MSPKRRGRTYIDSVLAGEEDWSAIDDWVGRWHETDQDVALHTFLGMTREECSAWAADARNISAVFYARRRQTDLDEAIARMHNTALAARTSDKYDPGAVQAFLREEGIISG